METGRLATCTQDSCHQERKRRGEACNHTPCKSVDLAELVNT